MNRPSAYCRLTGAMEVSGIYLVASRGDQVRIACHAGDEAALERWSAPAVLDYIDRHRPELWKWLKTPLDDLPEEDRRALYGTLGAASRTGGTP